MFMGKHRNTSKILGGEHEYSDVNGGKILK
jgi:hypothetical protein